LEMREIERDFQIVCARLKLANKRKAFNQSAATVMVGGGGSGQSPPTETVAFLVGSNLYEDAVKIASAFTPPLDYRPIVEGLASKCVMLARSQNKPEELDFALDWLADNNPVGGGADLRPTNAVESAWKLLENLVNRLSSSSGGSSQQLHKAVATRLISLGAFLPAWLVNSYKKADAGELMRLYLANGLLEDATLVCIEYVRAVLGDGKEYFGLDTCLQSTNPPVWLPHNTIDQIILELKDHLDDPFYNQLYVQLDGVLKKYVSTVARVSSDMIEVNS